MKILRFVIFLLLTLIWVHILYYRPAEIPFLNQVKALEKAPAFGHFFNPFAGFWVNAEPKRIPKDLKIYSEKLKEKVEIIIDDRLVPHIFAKNDYDLYLAQGYITAKYRLWQMELQTYLAGGRLAEILGKDFINIDLKHRRLGMVYAAEQLWNEVKKDESTKQAIEAYTEGVNAHITQLKPENYPLEYKLLGYKPEKWTPLKCALMMKLMTLDLAYNTWDVNTTNVLQKYGKDVIKELFGGYNIAQDPIIPTNTKYDFKKVSIPKIPKQTYYNITHSEGKPEDKRGIGSNNWAVASEKSVTGLPMLANDPHLSLSLPSIWFEIQLNAPKLNVYGASLPGTPAVVIGFNQDVAWGVTNVDADVQDFYHIKWKDNSMQEYWHNKEWKKAKRRIEVIKIKGQEDRIDTVIYTHHGPVLYAKNKDKDFAKQHNFPFNCAFKWIGHEPSNELNTFLKLNRSRNYEDYRKAIATYVAPAQNFIFCDNLGNIAITSNGKFPIKWKEQGKFILDGSNPEHDWSDERIPAAHNPHVKNPERGFVSSANQFPTDTLYPYYLHWEFATYQRGKRINERLTAMKKANLDSLRALQNDDMNVLARDILPKIFNILNKVELNKEEQNALTELKNWNFMFEANKIAPTIYTIFEDEIQKAIWQDEFGFEGLRYPSLEKTREVILGGDSTKIARWCDNINTKDTKETLKDVVIIAFKNSISKLIKDFGNKMDKWTWGKFRNAEIRHLARISPFSVPNLISNGCADCPNAISRYKGPSWRMVVAVSKTSPKAFGIYPGGQSGNVGSHYYANFIPQWQNGELAELLFLKSINDKSSKIVSKWKMNKN
jgi:penicillin amidase